MDDTNKLSFYERFFRATAFCGEEFFWRIDDNRVRIIAICNDVFWWGTADCEEVTPENIHILEKAREDLMPNRMFELYLSTLFAARVRQMRPQKPVLNSVTEGIDGAEYVVGLLEACGPERDE